MSDESGGQILHVQCLMMFQIKNVTCQEKGKIDQLTASQCCPLYAPLMIYP